MVILIFLYVINTFSRRVAFAIQFWQIGLLIRDCQNAFLNIFLTKISLAGLIPLNPEKIFKTFYLSILTN